MKICAALQCLVHDILSQIIETTFGSLHYYLHDTTNFVLRPSYCWVGLGIVIHNTLGKNNKQQKTMSKKSITPQLQKQCSYLVIQNSGHSHGSYLQPETFRWNVYETQEKHHQQFMNCNVECDDHTESRCKGSDTQLKSISFEICSDS